MIIEEEGGTNNTKDFEKALRHHIILYLPELHICTYMHVYTYIHVHSLNEAKLFLIMLPTRFIGYLTKILIPDIRKLFLS